MNVRTLLRRHSRLRRFQLRVAVRVAAGLLAGVVTAWSTLTLDRRAKLILPFPESNAQLILGTLVGAVLTITVFALWMRTVVVGLISSQVSPRVLTGYLDDRFQVNMTGWMMAAFTYLAAVTVALPISRNARGGVPAVSSILSLVVTIAAVSTVLLAMRNAISSLEMPRVIRSLSDRAVTVMSRRRWPNDPGPPAAGETRAAVHSRDFGWVQWVDAQSIMEALPPRTILQLVNETGDFVGRGDVLATADRDLDERTTDRILDSFVVVPTRASDYDLRYAIQQLVDVAEHAMTPPSIDTSTAYEALMHIRVVFDRLIRDGTATGTLQGGNGRWILSPNAWQSADYLSVALARLVTGGSQDPTTAGDLLATLQALERTADQVGDPESRAVVHRHLERLKDIAEPHIEQRGATTNPAWQ